MQILLFISTCQQVPTQILKASNPWAPSQTWSKIWICGLFLLPNLFEPLVGPFDLILILKEIEIKLVESRRKCRIKGTILDGCITVELFMEGLDGWC